MTARTKIRKAESCKQHSHLNVLYFRIPTWWSSLAITTVRKQWRAIKGAGNRSVLKEAGYISGFPLRTRALTLTKFSNFSVYLNFFIFAMKIMSLSFIFFSFFLFSFFFLIMKLEAHNVLRLICVGPESQGVEHFKASSIFQHMPEAHWDCPCIKN